MRKFVLFVFLVIIAMIAATSASASISFIAVCRTPSSDIPDNGSISDTVTVDSGGLLTDLDVRLIVPHTKVGDLKFTLEHAGGASVTIIDRPGEPVSDNGCSGDNYDVTVDDEGSDGDIENQCDNTNTSAIHGNRRGGDPPGSVLSAFDGEDFSGDWTLTVTDLAPGDSGALNLWCLIASVEPLSDDDIDSTLDEDRDVVPDNVDLCPGTVIPESIPTDSLGVNRWALVDKDNAFDTKGPAGRGPDRSYSTADTGGCSCEQIIEVMSLGQGHLKHGCSVGVMDRWLERLP